MLLVCTLSWDALAQIPTAEVRVHDPVMAVCDGKYYLFATGRGISIWSSDDMKSWKKEKQVFSSPPEWTVEAVQSFKGHFWAPDISFHNGLYYLYYSVSAFGKNTSCIGLVTNVTLNPEDPRYQWVDRGKVIQSYPGITNWNAIDPNIVEDEKGVAYMSFGSFWEGLKLVQLSQDRMTLNQKDTVALHTIASRKNQSRGANPPAIDNNPKDAGGNAIEAPYIFKKNGYYYLFASIDYCCKGVNSTYKMIVGRAKNVMGPYLDHEGNDLSKGGGKLLLEGDKRWHGVGHNSAYTFNGADYLIFHGYDGDDNGVSKLKINKLDWDAQSWPIVREDW